MKQDILDGINKLTRMIQVDFDYSASGCITAAILDTEATVKRIGEIPGVEDVHYTFIDEDSKIPPVGYCFVTASSEEDIPGVIDSIQIIAKQENAVITNAHLPFSIA